MNAHLQVEDASTGTSSLQWYPEGLARTDLRFWSDYLQKHVNSPRPVNAPGTALPTKRFEVGFSKVYPFLVGNWRIQPPDETEESAISEFVQAAREITGGIQSIWNWPVLADESSVPTEHDLEQPSEASTVKRIISEDLYQPAKVLFDEAREEHFEDGMESEFSRNLVSLVQEHGDAAVEVLSHLIVYEKVNPEVASEALRWLGRLGHGPSYQFRRWLLEQALSCSSPMVRDGAVLGLASMDDPHAITYLKKAIEREDCRELRQDMEQVLAYMGE